MANVIGFYSCTCMKGEVSFEMPARGDGQDTADWMKHDVTPALSADHRRRSPLCVSKMVQKLKIPNPEADKADEP
jgi:hypothetical protein